MYGKWNNLQQLNTRTYTCGYNGCGREVGSEKGWVFTDKRGIVTAYIYICPICECPTFFDPAVQIPGKSIGQNIGHLPTEIQQLYDEIRKSTSQGAYTAAVLACRKLLMHVAVEKGAKENLKFVDYVDYLVDKHYAPPNSKSWVDEIRLKGNEANHEIKIMYKNDAMEIIIFLEMLLKFVYEFPKKAGV